MNFRWVTAIFVCVGAGVLGWWMNQPPAPPPPKPAPASRPERPLSAEAQAAGEVDALLIKSIRLLEAHDMVGIIKTIMLPEEQQALLLQTGSASPEDAVAALRQHMPEIDQEMEALLLTMRAVRGQTPQVSDGGLRASYRVDPPIGGNKELTFVKVDGTWYLR